MGIIIKQQKVFCIISLLITICLLLSSCFPNSDITKKRLNSFLDSLPVETSESVCYLCYQKLYSDEFILDFNELFRNKNIDGYLKDVFCVKDSRVWFLYTSKLPAEGMQWSLASVSIPDKDLYLHYEGVFCFSPDADSNYSINMDFTSYSEMNGFFNNGKIILTDKSKLVEIDISDGSFNEYSYYDYDFQRDNVKIERKYNEIVFSSDNKICRLSFAEASELSNAFNQIAKLEEQTIHNGWSCMKNFFSKVQNTDGKYYIYGRLLNFSGETHMVVFEYDFYKNELKYLFNHLTYDIVDSELFVVPLVN